MAVNRHVVQLVAAWGVILTLACGSAGAQQAHYPSPEDAVTALLGALESGDAEALMGILGPELEDIRSGDPVADAAAAAGFVATAGEGRRVQIQGEQRAELLVGPDDWPFAIPLVKEAQGWRFDTAAGKEELLNRRIGRNELHAIATARAIVEAQYEYAAQDPRGQGKREYAQRIRSSAGNRDGLFWPTGEGEPQSPLGPLVAEAVQKGYGQGQDADDTSPYHGYYFRILTAQGPHAAGGAGQYLNDGHMTGGFGLLAYPAEYGRSGVMSFIVNQRGLLFQKDLGEETATAVAGIAQYDPDPGWAPVTAD